MEKWYVALHVKRPCDCFGCLLSLAVVSMKDANLSANICIPLANW